MIVQKERDLLANPSSWRQVLSRFTDKHILLLLLLPSFIVLFLLTVFPLLWAFWLSFTDYNLSIPESGRFVGLQTYYYVFTNPSFVVALLNTFYLVAAILVSETLLGLLLALLLARDFHGQRLMRVLFMIPMMTTPIVVALTWRMLFNVRFGYVDYFLGFLGVPHLEWLGHPVRAMLALIISDIWVGTSEMTILLLAGLVSLPEEPFEASLIDGASALQRFRNITLPLMRPVMAMAIMFRAVDAFRKFESIQIMTGGGPGEATTTINFLIFDTGFRFSRLADASVQAVVLVVLMLVVVSICVRVYSTSVY
jgi:multiple sugar transport system permease protein